MAVKLTKHCHLSLSMAQHINLDLLLLFDQNVSILCLYLTSNKFLNNSQFILRVYWTKLYQSNYWYIKL